VDELDYIDNSWCQKPVATPSTISMRRLSSRHGSDDEWMTMSGRKLCTVFPKILVAQQEGQLEAVPSSWPNLEGRRLL